MVSGMGLLRGIEVGAEYTFGNAVNLSIVCSLLLLISGFLKRYSMASQACDRLLSIRTDQPPSKTGQ